MDDRHEGSRRTLPASVDGHGLHGAKTVTMTTPTFAGNARGQSNTMIGIELVAAFANAPTLFDGLDLHHRDSRSPCS